jgi:hypothetical protein
MYYKYDMHVIKSVQISAHLMGEIWLYFSIFHRWKVTVDGRHMQASVSVFFPIFIQSYGNSSLHVPALYSPFPSVERNNRRVARVN